MEILKTISYTGTMEVLASLGNGPRRFSDIMFETKMNPGVLNRVLKTLIANDILAKRPNDEGYELTQRGIKVSLYILKILEVSSNETPENMKLIKALSVSLEHARASVSV